jgi:hypothetical protein
MKLVAYNIDWFIYFGDAYEKLDTLSSKEIGDALNIPENKLKHMNRSQIHKCAYDLWRYYPAKLQEAMGLPDKVEIPDEIIDDVNEYDEEVIEEIITEYLSGTYGFLVNGYSLASDKFFFTVSSSL